MRLAAALLLLLAAGGAAQAATYEQQLAKITRGLPRDARAFIQRRSECNHWAGEEGYDAARRHDIDAAVARLRCDRLEHDEAALRHHYRHRPKILAAMTRAAALDQ